MEISKPKTYDSWKLYGKDSPIMAFDARSMTIITHAMLNQDNRFMLRDDGDAPWRDVLGEMNEMRNQINNLTEIIERLVNDRN